MKRFTSFIQEAFDKPEQPKKIADDLVTIFGRHNPPHRGHGQTFKEATSIARNIGDTQEADQSFVTSRSQDPKKNPLPFQQKVNFLQRMFPEHAEKWDKDENVRTVLDVAKKAHGKGYKNFHFVGGGDRKQPMEDLLRKYNGNLYEFDNIYSHSAGERDPDSDDPIAKLSASGMRRAAMGGDMEKFSEGLPIGQNFNMDDAKQLFDQLRMYMQKNEEWEVDYRNNTGVIRNLYREGRLYDRGDVVESLSTGLVGSIHRCGSNHLICVTEDGIMFKSFVHDVQHVAG